MTFKGGGGGGRQQRAPNSILIEGGSFVGGSEGMLPQTFLKT